MAVSMDPLLERKAGAKTRDALLPETELAMPAQCFDRWAPNRPARAARGASDTMTARVFVFGLAAMIAGYGIWEMAAIVGSETTRLQYGLVVLFGLTFAWIALAAANAMLGFVVLMLRRAGQRRVHLEPRPLSAGTAVIMPIYNEDTAGVFARLRRMADDLVGAGHGGHFDLFVLSDTTDPDIARAEEDAARRLEASLAGAISLVYRRRRRNLGRKAGNVAEFVMRWGGLYDFMIVLDADSTMTAEAMAALVRAMEDDPEAGLLQTAPRCAGRNTLFARMQQFSTVVYAPILAAGLAAWHGREGNYWGHNAIIRVKAFAACCGLPELKGRKPFGGHILSHDFVEAALLRRAGWGVYMLPAIEGSYEEAPPSLLDNAVRDRRWAQGNLQHSKVVGAAGLHWMSRFHLVNGIMSYLASPLWLLFLVIGFILALQASVATPVYFPEGYVSLFPNWPKFDAERALALVGFSAAVLLAPKILGVIATLADPAVRRGCGGGLAVTASAVLETLVSALIAPVMMLIQTRCVAEILMARDSGWNAQRRDDGAIPLLAVATRLLPHTLAGVFLILATAMVSTAFLLWLLPVWLGLCLAIPIAWVTGLRSAGFASRRLGLFLIPEEAPIRSKARVRWRRFGIPGRTLAQGLR